MELSANLSLKPVHVERSQRRTEEETDDDLYHHYVQITVYRIKTPMETFCGDANSRPR
jgi:hypothetical protein